MHRSEGHQVAMSVRYDRAMRGRRHAFVFEMPDDGQREAALQDAGFQRPGWLGARRRWPCAPGRRGAVRPWIRGRATARAGNARRGERERQTTRLETFPMPIRLPLCLSVLLAAASAAAAETPLAPPPWPTTKESPVNAATDPVRPLLLGPLRVTLDSSTLADIRTAIGVGVATRQGSGTDALDWLCYTVPEASPPQRLWLLSSELARNRVDGVTAIDLPAGSPATAQCPELPQRFRPVRFDDGLWLGGLSVEQRRMLGMTPRSAGPTFGTLFHGQSGNLDLMGSVLIEFRGARAVALHIAHSMQN